MLLNFSLAAAVYIRPWRRPGTDAALLHLFKWFWNKKKIHTSFLKPTHVGGAKTRLLHRKRCIQTGLKMQCSSADSLVFFILPPDFTLEVVVWRFNLKSIYITNQGDCGNPLRCRSCQPRILTPCINTTTALLDSKTSKTFPRFWCFLAISPSNKPDRGSNHFPTLSKTKSFAFLYRL